MTDPQPEGIEAWLPDLSTPEKIEEHRKALEAKLGPLTAEARMGLPPIDENALVKQAMEALEAEGMKESEQAVASPSVGYQGIGCTCGRNRTVDDPRDPCPNCGAPHMNAPLPAYPAAPPAPIPLDDLRERIEICAKAWVQRYRDGNVEIVFDTEARKAAGPAKNGTQSF